MTYEKLLAGLCLAAEGAFTALAVIIFFHGVRILMTVKQKPAEPFIGRNCMLIGKEAGSDLTSTQSFVMLTSGADNSASGCNSGMQVTERKD